MIIKETPVKTKKKVYNWEKAELDVVEKGAQEGKSAVEILKSFPIIKEKPLPSIHHITYRINQFALKAGSKSKRKIPMGPIPAIGGKLSVQFIPYPQLIFSFMVGGTSLGVMDSAGLPPSKKSALSNLKQKLIFNETTDPIDPLTQSVHQVEPYIPKPYFWEHEFGGYWIVQFLRTDCEIFDPIVTVNDLTFKYKACPVEMNVVFAKVNQVMEKKVALSTNLARQYATLEDFEGEIKIATPAPIDHLNYVKEHVVSKDRHYDIFIFKFIETENQLK